MQFAYCEFVGEFTSLKNLCYKTFINSVCQHHGGIFDLGHMKFRWHVQVLSVEDVTYSYF